MVYKRSSLLSNPTYISWYAMKGRCLNPSNNRYKYYGARGIGVCKRWYDFSNFLDDMGERPFGKTLDRIDVNKNYSKNNCRWATKEEQARNKRRISGNSSGIRGITVNRKARNPRKPFIVQIKYGDIKRYARTKSMEEAIPMRLLWERELGDTLRT